MTDEDYTQSDNNKEKEMNGKGRVTIPTDIDVIEVSKEMGS